MLIDDIIINILIVLFTYLILYVIYYAFTVFISTKKKQIGLEQKFLAQDLPGNLIILVYATEGDKEVVNLVNMLKSQKYPKENYQIHVLFDNSNDDTSDVVEQMEGVKVWRINNGSLMGKDQALTWLLERLISFRNVNAFVFLDANRRIKSDFLSNVNTALFSSDIVVSATEYYTASGDVISAVKNENQKYFNRIFNTSRAVLGLMNPISSGAVAIKQEVLEGLKCVDFKDTLTEYKYSVFLASKGHTPVFSPDVRSQVKFENDNQLTLKEKFLVIKYIIPKLFCGNFRLAEYLFSFLKPSALLIIVLYLGFFAFLYNFEVKNMFFYDIKYIAAGAVATFVIFLISLIIASDEKINPILLFLNPIYELLGKIFKTRAEDTPKEVKNTNKEAIANGVQVIVSDGSNDLKCVVELKNTGNGMTAVFKYKSRTFSSKEYPSAKEALIEIADKLRQSGLILKVCSVCSHFGFKPNSDISIQTGLCSQKDKMTDDIQPQTTLLDSCEYFQSMDELNNVVDFPKDNNQNSDDNN